MDLIQKFEHQQVQKLIAKNPVPEFGPGDTLRVNVKVVEGNRERVQAFEGVCIARRQAGINSSFVVRKISFGEGVERKFPLYLPHIRIEVMRRGEVRRAKLYYLRGRKGKSARIAEKRDFSKTRKNAPSLLTSDLRGSEVDRGSLAQTKGTSSKPSDQGDASS